MATPRLSLLLGLIALSMLAAAPGRAAPESLSLNESFAQAKKQRPQIRINRYPFRRYHAVYPLPYDVEYPGPNGVRHCVNRYVTERRPSGNVLVPHMRCTWVVRR
jgi:hypothetical protein